MNTQPNTVGAIAEVERLGQELLEAVWKEYQATNPRHREILEMGRTFDPDNPDADHGGTMQAFQDTLGVDSVAGVITYVITHMQAAEAREQAVRRYCDVRRMLTVIGVL